MTRTDHLRNVGGMVSVLPGVDLVAVPSRSVLRQFRLDGWPAYQCVVTGLPVAARRPVDAAQRAALRRSLGLPDTMPSWWLSVAAKERAVWLSGSPRLSSGCRMSTWWRYAGVTTGWSGAWPV